MRFTLCILPFLLVPFRLASADPLLLPASGQGATEVFDLGSGYAAKGVWTGEMPVADSMPASFSQEYVLAAYTAAAQHADIGFLYEHSLLQDGEKQPASQTGDLDFLADLSHFPAGGDRVRAVRTDGPKDREKCRTIPLLVGSLATALASFGVLGLVAVLQPADQEWHPSYRKRRVQAGAREWRVGQPERRKRPRGGPARPPPRAPWG